MAWRPHPEPRVPFARPHSLALTGILITAFLPIPRAEAQSVRRAVTRLDGRTLSAHEVERTVERLMRAGRVPGLALAILNGGEVVYLRGFGTARSAPRAPLRDTTVMYAAES